MKLPHKMRNEIISIIHQIKHLEVGKQAFANQPHCMKTKKMYDICVGEETEKITKRLEFLGFDYNEFAGLL